VERCVRVSVVVSGKVQGVSFRWSTQTEARRLGLFRWARNLSNGTVEILAEGARDSLEELVAWCKY
jgi:acylphosphatase